MKQEIHFTEQWKKKEYGNKIRPAYEILLKKNFDQKILQKYGLETSFRSIVIFKGFLVKRNLRKCAWLVWHIFIVLFLHLFPEVFVTTRTWIGHSGKPPS